MIIPIEEIEAETLRNICESVVLREGTDYGEIEMTLEQKVEQLLAQLKSGEALVEYSEAHESVTIVPRSS